jgi:hypothetical protein
MMHCFASNLIAALLALHTVLGCCWHHAHRCTDDGRHDCQAIACVFVSSPKTDSHKPSLQFDAPPAAAMPDGRPYVCDVAAVRPFYPPDALLPPLRLHLVCRVLLI